MLESLCLAYYQDVFQMDLLGVGWRRYGIVRSGLSACATSLKDNHETNNGQHSKEKLWATEQMNLLQVEMDSDVFRVAAIIGPL